MTLTPFSFTISLHLTTIIIISLATECAVVAALGSASTVAVTFGTATVCGIIAGEPTQRVQCYQNGLNISVLPNVSFEAISGGTSFFCGLRSGGFSILCWETKALMNSSFRPKRIYFKHNVSMTDLAVGDDQVCAREVDSGIARCWRGGGGSPFPSPGLGLKFRAITSGSGFTCGILKNDSTVFCWGGNKIGAEIQRQYGKLSMSNLVAGDSHACGLTRTGFLVCKGNNESGQLDAPSSSAFEFSGLSLGSNFGCGIGRRNGLVLCWGGDNRSKFDYDAVQDVSFESIIAGLNFICGLTTRNLTMICWGPGWSNGSNSTSDLPLGMVIPGPCVQASCNCGTYLNSETLCDGSGNICKSCQTELPIPVPLTPILAPLPSQGLQPFSPARKGINRLSLAFLIVGSIGAFAGICTIFYCLWAGVCGFLLCKTHNSVQPTLTGANIITTVVDNNDSIAPPLRSFSIRRNSSRRLGRQRSGSSSSKHAEKTQFFSLFELSNATNNFSLENRIGAGSFGVVYKGKLPDGREVAIKRGETSAKVKKFQEKETAFDSEIALLSRLHHKHLVGLVGFCQENDERLLVYEYMSNGALYDHLHNKDNIEKGSSILNSWKMRIKIALDAARGIEYLHNYAVPPIIHRDIKSSNILLDANWTARVSDFGLSLMGPESDQEHMSTRAVGTVGYIDPEYYVLNVLTAKSDVYGLGVVLLELLTGRKAVFKNEEDGTGPMGVVEYASPRILAGDLRAVVDRRVGVPEIHEAEAVELMAYTAMHCVNLEGKERPNTTDIVANLERALSLCEDSPASLSSRTISIPSD
ncbi:PREDICTED: putative serine/threonine-protein kinase-like protein CCR3 isoform X1 [Theobroma cacao]|uniref:non-specific serine/threonine protein kinase n=1 Tax=Theobroma cacao TaxID=3641 RepID=A0AB32WU50_THECC|nr:PREDICTED: putative serine/threonine-protein kinase-like protein CCR3 isoform X1 [Theobroma cacao]